MCFLYKGYWYMDVNVFVFCVCSIDRVCLCECFSKGWLVKSKFGDFKVKWSKRRWGELLICCFIR